MAFLSSLAPHLGGARHFPFLGISALSTGEKTLTVIAKSDCQHVSVEEGIYVAFYAPEGDEEWLACLCQHRIVLG